METTEQRKVETAARGTTKNTNVLSQYTTDGMYFTTGGE